MILYPKVVSMFLNTFPRLFWYQYVVNVLSSTSHSEHVSKVSAKNQSAGVGFALNIWVTGLGVACEVVGLGLYFVVTLLLQKPLTHSQI